MVMVATLDAGSQHVLQVCNKTCPMALQVQIELSWLHISERNIT